MNEGTVGQALARRFAILALMVFVLGSLLLVLPWLGAAGPGLASSQGRGWSVVGLWPLTIGPAWALGTLAILFAWRPVLIVPYFLLSSAVLAGPGFLLLEVRDDNELVGPAIIVALDGAGVFLAVWFIWKAVWLPILAKEREQPR